MGLTAALGMAGHACIRACDDIFDGVEQAVATLQLCLHLLALAYD